MASKSKKNKGPDKKASSASNASKQSKDSKSKTPVKAVSKPKAVASKSAKPAPKPVPVKKSPAKPLPKSSSLASKSAKPATKPVKAVAKSTAKAPAKPVVKIAPKKPAQKGSVVKTAAKVAAKPVAKPTKATAKPVAKASSKTAPVVRAAPVKSSKAPAKPAAKAPVTKSTPKPAGPAAKAPSASKVSAKDIKVTAPKAAASAVAKGKIDSKVKTPIKAADVKSAAIAKPPVGVPDAKASKGKGLKIELFKGPFFQEVPVGSPATRKNKAPQVAPAALRKPKGEESHDELIARIERELLTVRMTNRKVQREQVCTKCCINPVEPGYMVDRDTGYCMECALVLGLGHTREARQQNFHPSLMKSEDEEAVEPEVVE